MSRTSTQLADTIRRRRVEARCSRSDLARAIGSTPAYVSLVEAGQRLPAPAILEAISQALSLPLPDLVSAYLASAPRLATLLTLAEDLLRLGEMDAALPVLKDAWRLNRRGYSGRYNGRLYHLLGVFRFAQGRYGTAERWFSRHQAVGSHHATDQTRGVAHYDHGLALRRLGRLAEALYQFRQAATCFRRARTWRWAGYAELGIGNLLLLFHAYPEALLHYRAAVGFLPPEDPYHLEARLGTVVASWPSDGPGRSLRRLQRLRRSPGSGRLASRLHHLEAVALRQMGYPRHALWHLHASLREVPAGSPEHSRSLAELALCHSLLHHEKRAARAGQEFLKDLCHADPSDVLALELLHVATPDQPQSRRPVTVQDDYEERLQAAARHVAGNNWSRIAGGSFRARGRTPGPGTTRPSFRQKGSPDAPGNS